MARVGELGEYLVRLADEIKPSSLTSPQPIYLVAVRRSFWVVFYQNLRKNCMKTVFVFFPSSKKQNDSTIFKKQKERGWSS